MATEVVADREVWRLAITSVNSVTKLQTGQDASNDAHYRRKTSSVVKFAPMAAVIRQGPIYTRIIHKLTEALHPVSLRLKDESHLHAGHKESPGLPETHFNLEIVSEVFEGMPLIQRQRKIYSILSEELSDRVHALSMKTKAPSECPTSS